MTNWEVRLFHMQTLVEKTTIVESDTISEAFDIAQAANPDHSARSARWHSIADHYLSSELA